MDIKPLIDPVIKNPGLISTLDIETITYLDQEIPIAITLAWIEKNNLKSKLFIINHNKLIKNKDEAQIKLFTELLNFININSLFFKNIFVHNLGSFDGYILYKNLLKIMDYKKISSLIDHHNKFVIINLNLKNINEASLTKRGN